MKVKPQSHKDQNLFKFQSTREQLEDLSKKPSILFKVKRKYQETCEEEKQSNFFKTLEEWSDRNCTSEFEKLTSNLRSEVQTLNQVLFNLNDIATLLQEALRSPKNDALDGTLKLVEALAKDAQQEFYPHLPTFFELIKNKLLTSKPEDITLLFECLTLLFRELRSLLRRENDVIDMYKLFSPLLKQTNKPLFITVAARCFANLIRWTPHKEQLLKFIFRDISEHPEHTSGVGQALFEAIRNQKKQFNYATETILDITFKSLNGEFDVEQVKSAALILIEQAAEHTDAEHCSEFYGIVLKKLEELVGVVKAKGSSSSSSSHLVHFLQVIVPWLDHRSGSLVVDLPRLIKILKDVLAISELGAPCYENVLKIIASLLMAKNLKMDETTIATDLIISVFKIHLPLGMHLTWCQELLPSPLFIKDIFPRVILKIEEKMTDLDYKAEEYDFMVLKFLAATFLHLYPSIKSFRPLPPPTIKLDKLHLTKKQPTNLMNFILENLKVDEINDENIPRIWSSLICLPFFSSLEASQDLKDFARKVKMALEDSDKATSSLLVLLHCLELIFFHLRLEEDFQALFSAEFFVGLLRSSQQSLLVLEIFNAYLTLSNCKFDAEFLKDIFLLLKNNLASPYHKIRLTTLQILNKFEFNTTGKSNIFEVCLMAETIPITPHDVREKLNALSKLDYEKYQDLLPGEDFKEVGVLFLIGNLQINFRLLWQPIQKLIASHAYGLGGAFWEMFIPLLEGINSTCKDSKPTRTDSTKPLHEAQDPFTTTYNELTTHLEKPDPFMLRQNLWNAMHDFSELAEPRNRQLVPLLLEVVNHELEPLEALLGKTQNIMKSVSVTTHLSNKDVETLPKDDHLTPFKDEPNKHNASFVEERKEEKAKHAKSFESLKAMLTLFSKFSNPKGLYREPEIRELYYQLLTFKDSKIQEIAFECIMTYHEKFLVPYKDNLSRIIKYQTFKEELVLFNLDSENSTIVPEHRKPLLAVLMRILYGKVLDRPSKGGNRQRRAIIMRFLGGCSSDELKIFMDLVFQPFLQYKDESNVLSIVKAIQDSLKLTSVIPISRMMGSLQTMETILDQIGNLAEGLISSFLKIIIIVGSHATVTLSKYRDIIQPSFLNILKELRGLSFTVLLKFFKVYESYEFTEDEIEAIFQSFIVPMISSLEFHSLDTPSPLLKVLKVFASRPRFFHLLEWKEDPPIGKLVALYCHPSLRPELAAFLTGIFHSLLTQDDELNEASSEGSQEGEQKVMETAGQKLLHPYFPSILRKIQCTLSENVTKKAKKVLSNEEMEILSRISPDIKGESGLCFDLAKLLLTVLAKSKPPKKPKANPFSTEDLVDPRLSPSRQEFEVKILTTVRKLLKPIDTSLIQPYLESWDALDEYDDFKNDLSTSGSLLTYIAPLFSSIMNPYSRTLLCDIVKDTCHLFLARIPIIVSKINAYEERIDEMDESQRLQGFIEAIQYIKCNYTWDNDDDDQIVASLQTIVYNCTFSLLHQNVDSSAYRKEVDVLVVLVQKLGELLSSETIFNRVIFDALFVEMRKGFQSKNRCIRLNFYTVMAKLLEYCSHKHPLLENLNQLCHLKNDANFWLEISREKILDQDKVLGNLSQCLREGKVVLRPFMFTAFLLPTLSSFIFDQGKVKNNHIIEVAIEALGSASSQLPWPRYEGLLRQYLNRLATDLDNLKVLVKVIVAILNNFPFNLVESSLVVNMPKLPIVKERIRKEIALQDGEKNIDGDEENEDSEDEDEIDDTLGEVKEKSTEEKTRLDHNQIAQITQSLIHNLLPKLQKSLATSTLSEDGHRYAKALSSEEQKLMKVPIALAMVKLLKKLPQNILHQHTGGIVLQLCNLLKSRLDSIRSTACTTLAQCAEELGPRFLRHILGELHGVMTKGYQVHIMCHTLHFVVAHMSSKQMLKAGDLDSSANLLMEVCDQELHGDMAEEKEVDKIRGKLKEARTIKSYGIYQLLGQYVSMEKLPDVLAPITKVLEGTHSHKTITKVRGCLTGLVTGITNNSGIELHELLIFLYQLLKKNIHAIMENPEEKADEDKKKRIQKQDSLLLPKKPKREGPKIAKTTNLPVLVEFMIKLLFNILKNKQKIDLSRKEILEMLDPFVPLLLHGLQPKHSNVLVFALKSYMVLVTLPMPSFQVHINKLVNMLFILLNNYSGINMGTPQGENFDVVVTCFKLLSELVKNPTYKDLSPENLKVLLSYIDMDYPDHALQGQAFNLLKAILSRGTEHTEELKMMMKNVRRLSIVSEHEHVRSKCREAHFLYYQHYKFSRAELRDNVHYYIENLKYEEESGRISALEMLHTFIRKWTLNTLEFQAPHLVMGLLNKVAKDTSPMVREMAKKELEVILKKVSPQKRNQFFEAIPVLIQKDDMDNHCVAVQFCELFAKAEEEDFEARLGAVLPFFASQLDPRNQGEVNISPKKYHFHLLTSLLSIISACHVTRSKEHQQSLNTIWENVLSMLSYPDSKVGHLACQLLNKLLASYEAEEFKDAINKNEDHPEYLLSHSRDKVESIAADLCEVLATGDVDDEHAETATRTLLFLSKTVQSCDEGPAIIKKVAWKLRRSAFYEVAKDRLSTFRRKRVFNLFGALSLILDVSLLTSILKVILYPLVREIKDKSSHADPELKSLAKSVVEKIRGLLNDDSFDQLYVELEGKLATKKNKRKQERDMEAVTNPERFAARKLKKQKSKQAATKRKLEEIKLGIKRKRRRTETNE